MTKQMSIPVTHTFEQITHLAAQRVKAGTKIRAAVVSGGAKETFEALIRAVEEGLIEPIIVGARAEVRASISGTVLDAAEIVDVDDIETAVSVASRMASEHKVDLVFADEYAADTIVSEIARAESGFVPKGGTASSVAVLKPEKYPKLLLLSDCAVNATPDLKAKLGIVKNIVKVAGSLAIENPRVAVLAAVEVVYPQMPVTMEGAVLAKMAERRQIKGAQVDGPLSFDVAMDEFAATSKGITRSPVAGQADAFLAPNVEVASGVYSAMSLFGCCERGSVIVGGAVPVVAAMRADSIDEILNSLYLGVLSV